jgi:hypothetical protein
MDNKQSAFAGIWSRYLPAIRILVKKAVISDQVIDIDRSDLELVAGIKKSGYRFSIDFIKDKPNLLFSNDDLSKAFIAVVSSDEVIRKYFLDNNYTFSFNTRYQLLIQNNTMQQDMMRSDR